MAIKERKQESRDGLPAAAFAIVGDTADPSTWRLPHHTRAIFKTLAGRLNVEKTVDWDGVAVAVTALSPRNRGEKRIGASPEEVIGAVRHLADHYRKAGKSLPDILAALV